MPLPKSILGLIGVLSGVLAVSAAGMALASVAFTPHAVWVVFGLELIMCLAGVLGALFSRGAYQEGQGMTLLCVGGTVLLGGFLSYLSTLGPGGIVFRAGGSAVSMTPWFAFRLAIAVSFLALASYAVLRRSRESMVFFRRGLIAVLVLAATAGGLLLLRKPLEATPAAIRGVIFAFGALTGVVGVAAAGHCFIRAFECGRVETTPQDALPRA